VRVLSVCPADILPKNIRDMQDGIIVALHGVSAPFRNCGDIAGVNM